MTRAFKNFNKSKEINLKKKLNTLVGVIIYKHLYTEND